jgi:Flp pilus assembly protein TadD
VDADPNNSDALYNLAQTLKLKKTGSADAETYMDRFQALEQSRHVMDRVQQLGNFGVEAASARNWVLAIADLKEALETCGQCSENAALHRDLGLIYCRKGDIEQGRRELKAALELKPGRYRCS